MSRPWMPLYIADYLSDTMHFNAAEHGAYLLLIMHYWQTGSLPDDEARLARIVRMTDAEWVAARVVIRPKFGDGWRHDRIEGELGEAERLAQAGRKGGAASAESRRKRNPRPKGDALDASATDEQPEGQRFANDQANDLPTIGQAPQPHPQKEDGGGDAGAREAPLIGPEAMAVAAEIGAIAGFPKPLDWPPGWCGAPMRVQVWIAEGWRTDIAIATARAVMANKRDGPPDSIKYFEKAIAREMSRQAAPLPAVSSNQEVSHAQAPRHATGWQRSRDDFRETLGQLGQAIDDAEAGERGAPGAEIIQIAAAPGRR